MSAPIHPNLITAARLPLGPVAVACLVWGTPLGFGLAAAIALLLEITDLADGWIARRYGVVSDFGKLFDPFSDAFSRFTLFLGAYAVGAADLWMILAIYYRDSTVAFLRSIAATRNVVVAARQSGKIKAFVQGVGTQVVFLSLLATSLGVEAGGWMALVPWWTMLFVTLATLLSLVDYVVGTWPVVAAVWAEDRAT